MFRQFWKSSTQSPRTTCKEWDQINECTLDVPSGRIVVAGCTDYFPDAQRVDVLPGFYRARVYYGKPNTLSADGLDGDDHYKVVLWKAVAGPIKILKQRTVSSAG